MDASPGQPCNSAFGRLVACSFVLDQEFQLLTHTPANDRVIRIEPHRDSLAIADLLADVVVNKNRQLFLLGIRPESSRKLSAI